MVPAQFATPAAVVLALGGLLACFAGYRLFRFVLGLYGFILGALVTTSMMGTGSTWALVLAAVVGGLVGAVLMIAAYFIGVGLVGAGLAAIALNVGWRYVAHADPPTVVLVIVCVLGALLALSVVRWVVIFGTAITGSWTFLIGALALAGNPAASRAAQAGDIWILYPLDVASSQLWITGVWLGLALMGVIVQLVTTSKTATRKKKVVKQ